MTACLTVGWGNWQHKLHSRIIKKMNTKYNTDPIEITIILPEWLISFRINFNSTGMVSFLSDGWFFSSILSRVLKSSLAVSGGNIWEYINKYIHWICVYLISVPHLTWRCSAEQHKWNNMQSIKLLGYIM